MDIEQKYKKLFIPFDSIVRVFDKESESWIYTEYLKKGFCTDKIIANHLKGNGIYGQELRSNQIGFFVVDLDFKEDTCVEEFWSRVDFCRKRIIAPSKVFQSSKSGGVHIYFFIKPTSPDIIKERVYRSYTQAGLKIRSGEIEIITSGVIRLPLGEGSYILDPETFQKIEETKEQTIDRLYDELVSKELPFLYEALPLPPKKKDKHLKSSDPYAYSNNGIIGTLLQDGIQSTGNTNKALMAMCGYYYNHLNKNSGATKREVKNWFINHHNNKSRTFNTNGLLAIEKKIKGIVNWIETKKSKIEKRHIDEKLKDTTVSEHTAQYIFDTFKGYTLQTKVFNLFKLIKILSLNGESKFSLSKYKLISHENSGLEFSSENYLTVKCKLIEDGFLTLISKGNNLKGCSSIYRMGLQLNSIIEYDEYAKFLIDKDLVKCYSRYYQKLILEKYIVKE